ncbi:MAG TPA: S8 family peptidase [Solirubrobacteraceae bacterium]|nr:S8 family peptidase [Solirubrobacteraceae bacterium]
MSFTPLPGVRPAASRARTALGIAAIGLALAPAGALGQSTPAPLHGAATAAEIKGQYIVVLKNGAGAASADRVERRARGRGGRVHRQYRRALTGFTAKLSDEALADVRSDPDVAYVEPDAVVSLSATQSGATWGLDRIDQRALPLNGTYVYTPAGAGVSAYVIDTGIRTTHAEFGGRAVSGYDAIDGGSADDCDGHGTHVAGTVGGSAYGVAKAVRLVSVRVLDCEGSGSTSGVIAGIDWVTNAHTAGAPAVANMSLGGSASSALDQAVKNSIADGVTYSIAAGNANANACNDSPGRVPEALTVGATTSTDARSSFSNYGTCLDLFAPGSSIRSAAHSSDTGTATLSGTSMAAPHVAGVAALYLTSAPQASPATVVQAIIGAATTGKVTAAGTGSPNRLLYSQIGTSTSPAPPPPPPPAPTGCGLAEAYSGSLSGTNDADIQPNGTSYTVTRSGTHRGCLVGPSTADFDLALYKRTSSGSWARVAVAQTASSTENVSYSGTAGTYRWRVYSYSGSGSYVFGMTRP